MSKFKVGDIVNVLYDFDKIVKGKVLFDCDYYFNYNIEILEKKDIFVLGQRYIAHEKDLKLIDQENTIEPEEVPQSKPSNDFIYFKELDIVVPKEVLQKDMLNIQPISLRKDNSIVNGFGVFLYSNRMLLKGFETKEEAQEFIKKLADTLGSDIL